ncbi:hypothetical protein [Sphingomonas sp. MMS24-J13]|uniref:hypothetical protein n=1 Tax=Sphingomonas sp. MMS24-J13 TaxID=3238686 RepID=UPI00384FFBDD
MIAALIMLAQASAPDVPTDEITVMAHRLESTSVWLSRGADGKLACGMNQSSGDTKIDAKLCTTAARCLKDGATAGDDMKSCIDKTKPGILREFAANRRAGRS